jgi:aryl-phospho-beta-D-glucosidase BglC (GH1 family)
MHILDNTVFPLLRTVAAVAASLAFSVSLTAAEPTFSDEPEAADLASRLPFVSVQGNKFVNEAGETVVFRGLAFSDPASLVDRDQWGRKYFEVAKSWGANVVRVPVHPRDWQRLGQEEYLKLLDDAVQWSSELGMYVIIDWHTIGNLLTGVFHTGGYQTTKEETFRFWYTIAQRYRDNPTVAFYELYNEPTNRNGRMGPLPWNEYKKFIEDLISMIYAIDDKVIPLVAGFNWGYDLRHVATDPIAKPGVAYVSHPYPQKHRENWEKNWEETWGFVAKTYPMVCTEFGFMQEDEPGSHVPVIGDEVYGEAIIKFFEERGISWTPWVFDPLWTPNMILDWDYTPSRQGEFFRAKMLELNK